MKKIPSLSISLTIWGALFLILSFFAEMIGLDKNPGDWSRSRIAVLSAGLFLIIAAIIYYRIEENLISIQSITRNWLHSKPVVVSISNNRTIKSTLDYIFNLTILIAVLLFYTWMATSGTWTNWKSDTSYYADLATSFRNGNLYLPIQPDPKLLALENPYDASQRIGINIAADISFYGGKIYMYWGPAPALILSFLQVSLVQQISDLTIAFFFVCGIFLVQSAILFTTWKWYFPSLPKWVMRISVLLAGLTGPLFLLRHNYESARIYQAAIAGAQFFLIFGIWVAFTSLAKSRISAWGLFSAGLLWALAIGTRLILIVSVGLLILLIAIWLIKINVDLKKTLIRLVYLCMPLAAAILCLGWYNWVRFGSITETGMYYQLGDLSYREHYGELFSTKYVIQNLYNMIIHPPAVTAKFPFVFMTKGSEVPLSASYTVPDFYNAQPITGLIFLFPFLVFMTLTDRQALANQFRLLFSHKTLLSHESYFEGLVLWLVGTLAIQFSLLLCYWWMGIRFIGDYIPALMIICVFGFWRGYEWLKTKKTDFINSYSCLGISLAGISILMSVMLVISTNSRLINEIIHDYPFLQ